MFQLLIVVQQFQAIDRSKEMKEKVIDRFYLTHQNAKQKSQSDKMI
jgi:hypothetical protein